MNARDVMTADVISVAPDMPVREIARLLLDRGISAVPVVDGDGAPLGIVSEGDLLGRDDAEREARRDWWLQLLAEGETLHPDFLASLQTPTKYARDVMSAPLVAVGEETDTAEIARLLTTHRVKRVPVVRDGRIVGIVSRADLLRALVATEERRVRVRHEFGLLTGLLSDLDERFVHPSHPAAAAAAQVRPDETGPLATEFQGLMAAHEHHEQEQRDALRAAALERRQQQVVQLIDQHVTDEGWRTLLHRAREAAGRGEKQLMLLRFPCELCSDGGRAINMTEPDWPSTLRGEAAELYLRWERQLKPHGFHLAASVLEFPGGKPGDIGMFLAWGG